MLFQEKIIIIISVYRNRIYHMNTYENTDKKELPVLTVSIYKKIYNIFFNYCFLWLAIILAIFLFIWLSKNTIALNRVDKYPTERLRLLKEINQETKNLDNQNITTKIIQWNLIYEDGMIKSSNNLISYKGFILPRNFSIYDNELIKSKSYFTWNYEINNLQYFIENVIFWDTTNNSQNIQFPLLDLTDNSIENTFFVSCLETNPNWLCKQFISNFTDTFYVYNLSQDYPWLNSIFNKIKVTDYKDDFCNWILKYVAYTKDTSADIEWILSQCGWDFYTEFSSKKSFYTVQQQLIDWYIKSTVSTDPEVNAYKLVSYQQILYNNVKNGIINEANFTTYLNYVSSLLKKWWSVDNIYYDITYWINNVYLIPTLNSRKYKLTENKRAELDEITNNIYAMNYWSKLQWHNWLESKIINKWLTKLSDYTSSWDILWHEQDETQQLLNNIKWLSYLKILDEEIKQNLVNVNGYMILSPEEQIYFWASFQNKNWKLVITKIWITDYEELNNTINTLLKKDDYTIIEIYEYITKSINLYSSNESISTCDIIKSKIKNIWATMSQCSSEKIIAKKSDGTNYKLDMDHYNITSITVSDKKLEEWINKLLKWIYTNDSTIPTVVEDILTYQIEEVVKTNDDISLNAINTIWTIKEYLWIELTDIHENPNWTVHIEFTLSNINFEWIFNAKTKLLYSLTFADKNITINNFKIKLDSNNTKEINKFINDTLQYLKTFDTSAVKQYQAE